MKTFIASFLLILSLGSAYANIDISIEEFQEVMEEAKVQVGVGYSIESISRIYTVENGYGFKIILNKLLGVNNEACYLVFPKSFGFTSRLEFSACEL